MIDILLQYGLFAAKLLTFVIALLFVISMIKSPSNKSSKKGHLEITDLCEQYKERVEELDSYIHNQIYLKQRDKEQSKQEKAKAKQEAKAVKQSAKKGELTDEHKPHLFVLDFNGSIDAKEVVSLREEITAILGAAKEGDEVLLRLETGGGMVHAYGLASSQLDRLKRANIKLTVAVDKVAASGGYMMACVADQIVSAPFAVVGSIGVIAQLPNFNKLLKKNDIEFEQLTSGEYKRTLTMFGENSDKAREKFKEELEQTHELFKNFIREHRPELDLEKVATGEHWFGTQALELGLVDQIKTSDDLIMEASKEKSVLAIHYWPKKKLADRFASGTAKVADSVFLKLLSRDQAPRL